MLNQVSMEAACAARYVENYLDCVENLPDDLQRMISRMRELDVYYLARISEIEHHTQAWKSIPDIDVVKKRNTLIRMQRTLIIAQELGDEKMSLVQSILDKIESKTSQLDHDYKYLDFGKDETPTNDNKEQQSPLNNSTSNTSINNSERPNKRARRTRQDTFSGLESNHNDNSADHLLRSQSANTPASQKKTNTGTGKKKKRKSRQNQQREESPPREEEPAIDPDEPTYCLCDQISFGEMIMCDNDLCPIEWFHFSCVTLTTKPKGKWYCPKCRGDRPNVMKPKAQFLKELEKYNREKEEKT
ncbi:inhibitor of growth protein 1 [Onthophagus taurus]|uniref:inhibitor of growth protein 1 n=1 Tax=Onthophagus taurus TaxID=166361 RepID=UPI000C203E7F|nr:inhibitor of growth protein 1 [Onthophagus taurus]